MTTLDRFPSERGYSDSFTVDRSELTRVSVVLETVSFQWNVEGGARETLTSQIRNDTTRAERLHAWRGICALPKARRTERGRWEALARLCRIG